MRGVTISDEIMMSLNVCCKPLPEFIEKEVYEEGKDTNLYRFFFPLPSCLIDCAEMNSNEEETIIIKWVCSRISKISLILQSNSKLEYGNKCTFNQKSQSWMQTNHPISRNKPRTLSTTKCMISTLYYIDIKSYIRSKDAQLFPTSTISTRIPRVNCSSCADM